MKLTTTRIKAKDVTRINKLVEELNQSLPLGRYNVTDAWTVVLNFWESNSKDIDLIKLIHNS